MCSTPRRRSYGEFAETLAASQIRKDLLNFLLVNLLQEGRGAQKAELEALANAFAKERSTCRCRRYRGAGKQKARDCSRAFRTHVA